MILLIVAACGKSKRPGLSDSELFAQKETADTLRQQTPKDSDAETYVVPPGIKYVESRAIEPANPPVVLDIANRKLNIKKFNLSDYYTKVRYIKIKHPMPPAEGNFLFDAYASVYSPTHESWRRVQSIFRSQIKFTNDYIVAGDGCFGLHCYDNEGKFLYTIESNDFPKSYDASKNSISVNASDMKGFYGTLTTNENNCFYCVWENNEDLLCLYDLSQEKRIMTIPFKGSALFLDNKSIADYVYELTDTVTNNFLFTFDLKGDTLCRFPNYNTVPKVKKNVAYIGPPSPNIYYYDKQLTIRQSMNDTVYRLTSPNRLVPAYVLNFGSYGLDVQTALYGDQSKKLRPSSWYENEQYVLFVYTQNRDNQKNRNDGSVKFFYAYYDKKSRQFYHFSEETAIPEDQFFVENPIPDALPFMLSYSEISDNQLRVYYSKRRLEEIIKNKGFASLSPEQQSKIKTMQNDLGESEVLIMILE